MKRRTNQLAVAGLLCLAVFAGCNRTQLTKFNNGELYSNDSVTSAEVKDLGEFLVESGFFDGGRKSVEIVRNNGELQFRMVVLEGYEADESYAKLCSSFVAILSQQVFDGEDIVMHLTDEYFQTLRVIEMPADALLEQAEQHALATDGADEQQIDN